MVGKKIFWVILILLLIVTLRNLAKNKDREEVSNNIKPLNSADFPSSPNGGESFATGNTSNQGSQSNTDSTNQDNPNSQNNTNPSASSLMASGQKHGIEIGSAVTYAPHLNNQAYNNVLLREFNLMVIGGSTLNWGLGSPQVRPSKDTYDFSTADKVIDFASNNNLRIQGHHLVWGAHEALPNWLKEGNFSRDELLTLIKDHIQTTMTRYKGRAQEWSVVNETVSRRLFAGLFGEDFWYEKLGDEYIASAFRWAREADPGATLILNDFGNEKTGMISNQTYNLVKSLKDQGVPIDGLGMQMHLNASSPPSKSDVIKTMQRFGSLGLKIYVTEFDVNLSDVGGSDNDRFALQAQIYKDMVGACKESGVCVSFAVFEFSDANTWYRLTGKKNADPLPFDSNYQPKPAYYSILEALK